jgi:hypothetical protein
MEHVEPDPRRLAEWARMLGAQQEARRVHSPRLGTEHLLMATYADPEVRRRLAEIGADMRAVQARVGTPAAVMGTSSPRRSGPSSVVLSDGAVRVLHTLLTTVGEDPVLARWADPGRERNPRVMSGMLRLLLIGLLRDPGQGTARRIVEDLTGGRSDPEARRGAELVADLLGDPPRVPGRAVPLSRPAPD